MKENNPNQERNLSLDRTELNEKLNSNFSRADEILSKTNTIERDGKQIYQFKKDSEEHKEYSKIIEENRNIITEKRNIDEYIKIAKPDFLKINNFDYIPDNITEVQELNTKVNAEILKTKQNIETTTAKLNDLRTQLGMPPSEDIPSLIDKKQKLEQLLSVQKEFENKLNFEKQKTETQNQENSDNLKRENRNTIEGIGNISSSISALSKSLELRQAKGFNEIFQNQESLRTLANQNPDNSNLEEIKNYLLKLRNITENTGNLNSNDQTESMYEVSRLLKLISLSIQEFTSKIKNENIKKEIMGTSSAIIENINKASSLVASKASAIEAYKNVKLP